MVFSSVPPVYLDPPNWHHHHHLQTDANGEQLQPAEAAGNNNNSNKPGSMSERARVAKIPQPETALKCPRCESTNTKFCYFNNYNLSQPRHFCKTCRRYWTRGGALRNVPVGGGCRRNKKISKKTTSSSSKSRGGNTTHEKQAIMSSSTAHHNNFPPPQSQFLSSLHSLGPFGGLNIRGIQAQMGSSAHESILSADQWTSGGIMQNFPFLAGGFHQPPPPAAINSNHMFTFQNEGSVNEAITRPSRVSEAAKVEDSQLGLSSAATSFLGNNGNNNNQYYSNSWGGGNNGNMWNGNGAADQLPGQQLNSSGSGDPTTHYL